MRKNIIPNTINNPITKIAGNKQANAALHSEMLWDLEIPTIIKIIE